jgi:hypothetical protein
MVEPLALPHLLKLITRERGKLCPGILKDLIDLLQFEIQEFGLEVNDPGRWEMKWICQDDLHELFETIYHSFSDSEFSILISATLDAISAILDFSDLTILTKLVFLVSLIANLYCEQCTNILTKILNNTQGQSILERPLQIAITKYWTHDLPFSFAPIIIRFALNQSNPAAVVANHSELTAVAIATDRSLAFELATVLERPPPPIPTFLSFAQAGVFPELVISCITVFPIEQWILQPGDSAILANLPILPEKLPSLFARIKALEIPAQQHELQKSELPKLSYVFHSPEVIEIPYKVRPTEPATLANLKAFLWHNGGKLDFEIDEIVQQFNHDFSLIAGYFLWASHHGIKLDVIKWSLLFPKDKFDGDFILAVAALLLHASSLNELSKLVHLAVVQLGVPEASRQWIIQLLRGNRGLGWFLSRNLIRANLAVWNGLPLIEILADAGELKEALIVGPTERNQRQFVFEMLGTLSHTFCVPDVSATTCIERFPSCYEIPYQLKALAFEVKIARPKEIDGEVFELIIGVLERNPPIRWEIVHLFGNLDLTKERVKRVRKILRIDGNPMMKYRLPTLAVNEIDFFSEKPPSFTRAFCRCLFSQLVQPLSETVVSTIGAVLTPVHPALFYGGLLHNGVRISVPVLKSSQLRLGGIPKNVSAELKGCGGDSIPVFEAVLKLDREGIANALPGIENRGGKDAVIVEFVEAAAGTCANVQFAEEVFRVMERMFSMEVLLTVICREDFVSQPNLSCVVHIFRRFIALLKGKERFDFLEFVEAFIGNDRQLAGSEFRGVVLRDLNNADTINVSELSLRDGRRLAEGCSLLSSDMPIRKMSMSTGLRLDTNSAMQKAIMHERLLSSAVLCQMSPIFDLTGRLATPLSLRFPRSTCVHATPWSRAHPFRTLFSPFIPL